MIELRRVTSMVDDGSFLLAVRNDPTVRERSANRHIVDGVEHRAWLASALSNSSWPLFVIEDDGQRVGSCRIAYEEFDAIGPKYATLSVSLLQSAQGRGRGSQAVGKMVLVALDRGVATCRAAILTSNYASMIAFARSRFSPTSVVVLSDGACCRWQRMTESDDARRLCPGCVAGAPHHQMSSTSIGGARDRVALDIHEIEDSGGVGLAECAAYNVWRRLAR